MQQPKNPESATTTTQFFNNQTKVRPTAPVVGEAFMRQFLCHFGPESVMWSLSNLAFFFFRAPRVERLWAFQKFHMILLASPRSQTAETFVQRLDGGTSMMLSLWKEMSTTTQLTCAVLAELMHFFDVITQRCKLPLHFYSQFFKTHSVCQGRIMWHMGTGCHEYLLTQITEKKHETSLFGNMGLHWATQLPSTTHWSDHLYPTQWRLWVSWTKSFQFH